MSTAQAKSYAITPSDATLLSAVCPAPAYDFWIGGAGNLAVQMEGDTVAQTLTAVAAGTKISFPFPVKRIMATNTTCTLIVLFGGQ